MDVLVGWFWALEFWHWWALALALLALEVFVTSTAVLLWPAIGSFVVGVVVAFAPDLDWRLQLLVLALVSGLAAVGWELTLGRRKRAGGDHPTLNLRTAQYVGRRAVLTEPLVDGSGRASFDDTLWQVRSEEGETLAAGSTVEVVGADGATLLVRPVR